MLSKSLLSLARSRLIQARPFVAASSCAKFRGNVYAPSDLGFRRPGCKAFSGSAVAAKDDAPPNLMYTEEHEWLALEDAALAVVGITSYASNALGDVVYVELPAVGTAVVAGETIGAVESVKSASDIYSPISGEVIEVNDLLDKKPGLINSEPYGKGWICKIAFSEASEFDSLMDEEKYKNFIQTS